MKMLLSLLLILNSFTFSFLDGTVKAIIFDCDGTLVDNSSGYFMEWQYALKKQGYELTENEFWDFMNKNSLVGLPHAEAVLLSHYSSLLGKDCSQKLLEDKEIYSKKIHEKGFPPIEATVNFLKELHKEKESLSLKIGLASGGSIDHILQNLRKLKIEHLFDVIVSGADDLSEYQDFEGTNKPKPYVYLKAAKQLRIAPEDCVAIEDSNVGVTSAVQAKCFTVAIPNAFTLKEDLSAAHLKLISLKGVSPKAFLSKVEEVKGQ